MLFPVDLCSSENSLRLYNPYSNASTDEGMVQVCRSNIWTAVCGHYWGCNEGKAACKQLGYGGSYLSICSTFKILSPKLSML